jgi:hypothetical protein
MYENKNTGLKTFFLEFAEDAQLELMWRPEPQSKDKSCYNTGYTHLAFSAGGKAQVDTLTERLKADGWNICSNPRTTGDGYYESCIEGPEHN